MEPPQQNPTTTSPKNMLVLSDVQRDVIVRMIKDHEYQKKIHLREIEGHQLNLTMMLLQSLGTDERDFLTKFWKDCHTYAQLEDVVEYPIGDEKYVHSTYYFTPVDVQYHQLAPDYIARLTPIKSKGLPFDECFFIDQGLDTTLKNRILSQKEKFKEIMQKSGLMLFARRTSYFNQPTIDDGEVFF